MLRHQYSQDEEELIDVYVQYLRYKSWLANLYCNLRPGEISVQNIPHGPVHPAGIAGCITLDIEVPTMHITLKADATDEELRNFAWLWATLLCEEDYTRAFNQLLHRADHPGRSWCGSAEDLRNWVEGYGTDDPDPTEPLAKVTCPVTAEGDQPLQDVLRETQWYPDFVARLDFWLPVDGEWSDLMASFDFVRVDDEIAPVLVALRVP